VTVQAAANSQVGSAGAATAQAQVGSGISTGTALVAGQSLSTVSAYNSGALTLALGSMGAGGLGSALSYQQSATFSLYGGGTPFLLDLTGSNAIGTGFDSAQFMVLDNGNLLVSESFSDLADAQAFFSNDLLSLYLLNGFNDIQLAFSEVMSEGQGFSFDFTSASISATPLPPAWTMLVIGLTGLLGASYRKRVRERVSVMFGARIAASAAAA
jgi:hypothetical protein